MQIEKTEDGGGREEDSPVSVYAAHKGRRARVTTATDGDSSGRGADDRQTAAREGETQMRMRRAEQGRQRQKRRAEQE